MSTRHATARSPRRPAAYRATSAAARRAAAERTRRRTARTRRRRVLAVLFTAAAVAGALVAIAPLFHHAVREIALPLRHDDVIRQQAAAKHLDPALIAAVIYTESRFRDGQVSSAGARGLMQLTPDTARYIARKSGGSAFTVADLATPQVNIAYGSWYLRYLLDRYDGNATLAVAAYNGGEGNVDRWVARAGRPDRSLRAGDIPFPETRAYVAKVLAARSQYRVDHGAELRAR